MSCRRPRRVSASPRLSLPELIARYGLRFIPAREVEPVIDARLTDPGARIVQGAVVEWEAREA